MDSGAIKELSMKISSHPNPPEPEGQHPHMKKELESMENIKSNYLKEVSIQEELKKVKIENYLEFFGDGRYEFYKCSGCFGPQLGHITQKCIKLKYEKETVQDFEIYLKEIGGFKEAIWRREEEIREKKEKIRAKEMVEAARAVESNTTAAAGTTGGGVTQLVKPRPPPLWTGQKFDRWKAEVISWHNHGRGNDEEKYLYLIKV